jgi:hypothetical protein
MRRGQWLGVAIALVSGLILVGCGGGGSQSPSDARSPQNVARCEQSIQSAPQLSGQVKSELQGICREAAKGDKQAVSRSTKQVCVRIIQETVPAGSARQEALRECGQGP